MSIAEAYPSDIEASLVQPLVLVRAEAPDSSPTLYLNEWDHPDQLADCHDRQIRHWADMRRSREPAPTYLHTEFARQVSDARDCLELFEDNPGLMVYSMGQLAETAETAGLKHLIYGLYGYASVTDACARVAYLPAGHPEAFDDPAKILRTMPKFYGELLKALDHHINGRPYAVEGWHEQFYSKAAREAPPSIAMIDFLTAHVRYDLAVALFRTETEQRHLHDYTANVNAVLTNVAIAIMDKYAQFPLIMRAAGIDKLGLAMTLRELFEARDEAWQTSIAMFNAKDSADYAAIRAEQRQRTRIKTLSGRPQAGALFKVATRVPLEEWDNADKLVVVPTSLSAAKKVGTVGLTGQVLT